MRITEAARRLGTSPRMLRYREALGLLPPTRQVSAAAHRRFGEDDLRAVALALSLEKRYDVGPAELAFGLRVLAEADVRAAVRDLGVQVGRLSSATALDFDKSRALRRLPSGVLPPQTGSSSRRTGWGRGRS